MKIHTAVCRTGGCVNVGAQLALDRPADLIYCAICANQITDITPPLPDGGYPPDVDTNSPAE